MIQLVFFLKKKIIASLSLLSCRIKYGVTFLNSFSSYKRNNNFSFVALLYIIRLWLEESRFTRKKSVISFLISDMPCFSIQQKGNVQKKMLINGS